jgi:hypothetical protein
MSMHTNRRSRRGGFTVLELLFTVVLMPTFLISATLVLSSSRKAFSAAQESAALQAKVDRAASRVAREMLGTSIGVIVPDPDGDLGSPTLTFRNPVGLNGDVIDWGDQISLGFEYAAGEADDGLDNNGNGLVDEGELVLTRDPGGADEQRVVLCRNVSEFGEGETLNGADDNGNLVVDEAGFNVQRTGDILSIRLTVETMSSTGELIRRSTETSLHFRN